MKKIILALTVLSLGLFVSAQSKLKQGVASFDITYPELTEQMKQMESMLPKSLSMYFKNDNARMEMAMPTGSMITLADNSKKEIIILMDMMGKKIAIKQGEKDINEKQAELKKKGMLPEYKLTLYKETKVIAGYTCKKATVASTLNGKTENLVCYYTEELPKITGGTDVAAFKDINGFLMEYNISQSGLKMQIKARSIKSETVADSKFVVPSNYKIMTPEEITEMMQGMQGKE